MNDSTPCAGVVSLYPVTFPDESVTSLSTDNTPSGAVNVPSPLSAYVYWLPFSELNVTVPAAESTDNDANHGIVHPRPSGPAADTPEE